jgi:broad specificity phosphatase PhoE
MAELYLIRHAQARFGADVYDKLSEPGHKQSYALGQALAGQGVRPDAWMMADMHLHHETIEGIAKGMELNTINPEIHTGLNEFVFTGLLNAHYRGHPAPENMHTEREIVLAWQADDIKKPPET